MTKRKRGTAAKEDAVKAPIESDKESSSPPPCKRPRSATTKPTKLEFPPALDIARPWKVTESKNKKRPSVRSKKKRSSNPLQAPAKPPPTTTTVATQLTALEAKLWSHGAKYAAVCHKPGNKVRLVGTITRRVHVPRGGVDPFHEVLSWNSLVSKQSAPDLPHVPPSCAPPTLPQTKRQVLSEDVTLSEDALLRRAQERWQAWREYLGKPYAPGWNAQGQLLEFPVDGAIPVQNVLDWLTVQQYLQDAEPDLVRSYYHGHPVVPIDTETVLISLHRLGGLDKATYQQPMLVSCVVPQRLESDDSTIAAVYQLTMPVYAHRLVFEVLWLHDAQTVWSALDADSYQIVKPLQLPPIVDPPVFQSSPTPRVIVDDQEDYEQEDDDADVLLQGSSTRRSDEISAYTFAGLLKLLESPGCDTSMWSQVEAQLNGQLQVDLLPHQKHGVCWMMQQEQIPGGLNALLWEERQFADGLGTYFYSPAVGQIRLLLGGNPTKQRGRLNGLGQNHAMPQRPSVGGILSDEMGLGKTAQVLALICATRDDNDSEEERTTLIIVPPALLTQWENECQKITGDSLSVTVFNPATLLFDPPIECEITLRDVDVVLTTYPALSQPSASRILGSYAWKRIVLDEMQEIRSSTSKLAQNCQSLMGRRRWMLSGTPLFESIDDLRGELNFLGLEPFAAANDDGFFKFCIGQHWDAKSHYGLDALRALSLVMLRRSKNMTYLDPATKQPVPLMGLPPLTVTHVPVAQDTSERAIYCFLEYLVYSNLSTGKEDDAPRPQKKEGTHTRYLKLLRDACLSAHLLTGAPGSGCALDRLDRIMIEKNRKRATLVPNDTDACGDNEQRRVLSVDEAIEFLSCVVESARVSEDFVTTQVLGGGMGRSNRDRAADSAAKKLEDAKGRLQTAQDAMKVARAERAKARWHQALEMITTGQLELDESRQGRRKTAIRNLWKWRNLVLRSVEGGRLTRPKHTLPLCRGWRPSPSFFFTPSFYRARRNWRRLLTLVTRGKIFQNGCFQRNQEKPKYNENFCKCNQLEDCSDEELTIKTPCPVCEARSNGTRTSRTYHALWRWRFLFHNLALRKQGTLFPDLHLKKVVDLRIYRLSRHFRWAHPQTVLLKDIPRAVSKNDLCRSIVEGSKLSTSPGQDPSQNFVILPGAKNATVWSVFVHFRCPEHFAKFKTESKKRDGVAVETDTSLPWLKEASEKATEALKDADAAQKVYPCEENLRNYQEARRASRLAELGLRMHWNNKREGHVNVVQAFQQIRTDLKVHTSALVDKCSATITGCGVEMTLQKSVIEVETRMVERLNKATHGTVPSDVQNLSTFEVLEALRDGKNEQTSCPVCLNPLGQDEGSNGHVALTKCGHLFCVTCLAEYFKSRGAVANCITCRKPVASSECQRVDPSRKDDDKIQKREAARSLVRSVCKQLEASNGHLEPSLWEALYLSFEVPRDVSKARHSRFTNLPGDLLAHLRHVTGLSLNQGKKNEIVDIKLSSKVRRLVEDLPRDERSVVFASTSIMVKHLVSVLGTLKFPVWALFTGQSDLNSSEALDQWRSDPAGVLLVQTGAAACGLTLTDASKMFMMEPLSIYEQEQQAYSRLHRYGQTKHVECKVYFTPVSVESRLLEWRKLAKCKEPEDEEVIFAKLQGEEDGEADMDEMDERELDDIKQSRYLLGLDMILAA